MEDVHHRQPDGTIIYGKRLLHGKPKIGILVIADVGETLLHSYYDKLCSHILGENMEITVFESRGHKLSDGFWSLHSFRADITYWIAEFRKRYDHFYVIATGFAASTMLEYDDQAHTFRDALPPLPDGMVLLDPVFSGMEVLPQHGRAHKVVRSVLGKIAVERKLRKMNVKFQNPVAFWNFMESYELSPVRIQTPTVMFVSKDELSDPLQRVFGSVNVQKMSWLHHGSHASLAKHISDVKKALETVIAGEKPHRFKALL